MIEAQPSRTAFRVALRRAAHQLHDRPLVFEDPIAVQIIGRERADALRANPLGDGKRFWSRNLRAFVCVRHRIAEDALARGVERGVTQYVILGAGLDTFAFRGRFADRIRVFEVDAPATQKWKRELLPRVGLTPPSHLTFVPVDFEKQSLGDELASAGFDMNARTVFAWLGVVPYLTDDAIMATLRFIARATQNGGGAVFDYGAKPATFALVSRFAGWMLARRVAAAGEPFRSAFEPKELTQRIRALGFTDVEDLDGAAINSRYFAGRTDGLRVGSLGHIISAMR